MQANDQVKREAVDYKETFRLMLTHAFRKLAQNDKYTDTFMMLAEKSLRQRTEIECKIIVSDLEKIAGYYRIKFKEQEEKRKSVFDKNV